MFCTIKIHVLLICLLTLEHSAYGTIKTAPEKISLEYRQDLARMYNHQIVVTNTGQGRLCPIPPCPCQAAFVACHRHAHGDTRATARPRL